MQHLDNIAEKSVDVSEFPEDPKLNEDVPKNQRLQWDSKLAYILTMVSYAISFGNMWRFPYLLHSNGGVTFLIPYFIMLSFVGIPMFLMELAIGQRMKRGAVGSWNAISPYLAGIGPASGAICLLVCLYFNALIAYVISYFIDSFKYPLPWMTCQTASYGVVEEPFGNGSKYYEFGLDDLPVQEECEKSTSAQYYWFRRTLNASSAITQPGEINWYLQALQLVAWTITAVTIIQGIKSAGKFAYVTAILPYFVLTIFLIGNFFQKGVLNGYYYLLKPMPSKLLTPRVWLVAGTQIFFSLGLAFGCFISFSSYLPPDNNCYHDAIIVSLINSATSIFASMIMFPILGIKGTLTYDSCIEKRKQQVQALLGYSHSNFTVEPLDKGRIFNITMDADGTQYALDIPLRVIDCDLETFVRKSGSGTGLVFIAFTEAVTHYPGSNIWSVLFFIMMLALGTGSMVGMTEGAITACAELQLFKIKHTWILRHFLLLVKAVEHQFDKLSLSLVLVCFVCLCFSLIFSPGWGIYVLNFVDQFSANYTLVIVAFCECIAVSWIYGLPRFSYEVTLMTGSKPNLYFLICWKYVSPAMLLFILIGTVINDCIAGVKYSPWNETAASNSQSLPYPSYIYVVGYIISFLIVCLIPLGAILAHFKRPLVKGEKPEDFPDEQLREKRHLQPGQDVMRPSICFEGLESKVLGMPLRDVEDKMKGQETLISESLAQELRDAISAKNLK